MKQMMKRITALLFVFALLLSMLPAVAAEVAVITVESKSVSAGEGTAEVELAVDLENNPGIAGGILSMSYDPELTLDSVSRGTALSTLHFTPSGDLTENPINLVYDGTDADTSNGTLFTVTFTVPITEEKTYDVTLTYQPDGIYGQNMESVEVQTVSGGVTVEAPPHVHDYVAVVTPPTYKERGYTTYTCSCGDSYIDDYVDPLDYPGFSATVTEQDGVLEVAIAAEDDVELYSLGFYLAYPTEKVTLLDDNAPAFGTGFMTVHETDGQINYGAVNSTPVSAAAGHKFLVAHFEIKDGAEGDVTFALTDLNYAFTGGSKTYGEGDTFPTATYTIPEPPMADPEFAVTVTEQDGILEVAIAAANDMELYSLGAYLAYPTEKVTLLDDNAPAFGTGFMTVHETDGQINYGAVNSTPVSAAAGHKFLVAHFEIKDGAEGDVTFALTDLNYAFTGGNKTYGEGDTFPSATYVIPEPTVTIVDSGTCGANLTWTLNSDGVLTISGTGAMRDYVRAM